MKNFEGKWRVQPFTQATLDEVSGRQPVHVRPHWLPAAFDNLPLRTSPSKSALSVPAWSNDACRRNAALAKAMCTSLVLILPAWRS